MFTHLQSLAYLANSSQIFPFAYIDPFQVDHSLRTDRGVYFERIAERKVGEESERGGWFGRKSVCEGLVCEDEVVCGVGVGRKVSGCWCGRKTVWWVGMGGRECGGLVWEEECVWELMWKKE